VEVRLYATLRPIVGGRLVELPDTEASDVRSLIDALIARFPALAGRLLSEAGEIRPYVAVMIDGRDVRHLGGLDAPVPAGAEVDIFPPVAGGAGARVAEAGGAGAGVVKAGGAGVRVVEAGGASAGVARAGGAGARVAKAGGR